MPQPFNGLWVARMTSAAWRDCLTWALIGIAILLGLGIMFAVAQSGVKENIQIDRK